jgi:polyhydroxyalkanoic acid synthase PhaR subunit
MNQNSGELNPVDPLNAWRGMRDSYMESWSKAMIDAVNSEAYAQATGVFLDSYLAFSTPFREVMQRTMAQVLEQLNMPARDDITRVAERLTNIEMRLDDLDAKLDGLQSAAPSPAEQQPGGGKKGR